MLDKQEEQWQVFIRGGSWWRQMWLASPWHKEGGLSRPLQALLSTCISPVISNGPTSFPGWDQQPPGGFPESSHHLCAGTKLPSGIGQSEPSPRGKRKRFVIFWQEHCVLMLFLQLSWMYHFRPTSASYWIKVTASLEPKKIMIIKNKRRKKVCVSFSFDFKAERNESLGRDILLRQSLPENSKD